MRRMVEGTKDDVGVSRRVSDMQMYPLLVAAAYGIELVNFGLFSATAE
jgi:hypothetical protein